MVYSSVLFGLLTALCWGTADYMSRRQSERVGHYKTVVYSQAVTLAVLLALLPFLTSSFSVPLYSGLALVLAGLLNFVAFIFLYRAFHKGVVSVVAPVAYTYPAITTVLSIAILGTVIAANQITAIAGVIIGVVLLSTRFSELRAYLRGRGAPNMTAGVGAAIGSSVFFGVVYIGVGYASPNVNYAIPAVVLRGVAALAGFSLAPLLKQDVRPTRALLSNTILVMAVLEAVGFLSFTYGISQGGSSLPIVAALSGMGGAVATTYAIAFLKERPEANQIVGIILSLAGVFTLLYLVE
jgi:drug/metabolite transporter (DMT)-like permease